MRKRMRNQGTKNTAKNMARISRIQPYLMRTYIYHSMRRDTEAANDLIVAWKISPETVLDAKPHYPFFEAICLRSQSAETILFLTELASAQAAVELSSGKLDEGRRLLSVAISRLGTLKPPNEADETLVMTSVPGEVVYNIVTRCATLIVKTGNAAISKEFIKNLDAWVLAIFGDSFESLSNLNNDSSDVARGEKSKG